MIGSQSGCSRGTQGREKSRGYSGGSGMGAMARTPAEAMMGTVEQCGATLRSYNWVVDENSGGDIGRDSDGAMIGMAAGCVTY